MEDGQVVVEIDEELMKSAIRDVLQKGLADGIGSYEVQRQVREAVEKSIDATKMPALIEAALTSRLEAETAEIVTSIVDDAMPMLLEAFRQTFRHSLSAMVYGLMLGAPSGGYQTDEQKAAWRAAQAILGDGVSA